VLLDGSGFLILWLGVSAVLNLYHSVCSAAVFAVEGVEESVWCAELCDLPVLGSPSVLILDDGMRSMYPGTAC
jgi:hypothetical protein